jgi:hypothetical protein
MQAHGQTRKDLEKLESMQLQERALVPFGYAREVVDFHVPHSRASSLLQE